MKNLLVLTFFTFLTLFRFRSTLPYIRNAFITLSEDFTNLHWIFCWGLKHLTEGFSGYWSTPFYTPLKTTLGYSEQSIGSSLLALPFYLATQNTVYSYNIVLFLSFILTGFCVYLLCYELTKSLVPSVLAGFLLSFGAYRMGHLDHLHILPFWGIPLFLFFAHRYGARKKLWDLKLAFGALALQCLTGLVLGTYAFYLSLLFWGFLFWTDPSFRTKKNRERLLYFHIGLAIIMVWEAFPNLLVRIQEGGAGGWRWGDMVLGSATIGNFLVPAKSSVFAADWMNPLWRGIYELSYFPGMVILLLGGYAIWRWSQETVLKTPPKNKGRLLYTGFSLAIGVLAIASVYVFIGPSDVSLKSKFALSNGTLVLLLTRILIDPSQRKGLKALWREIPEGARFYVVLALIGFFFSFSFFYWFLWRFVPPFGGIRVAGRMALFNHLGLAVLASFGGALLLRKFSRRKGVQWGVVIFLLGVGWIETLQSKPYLRNAPEVPPVYDYLVKKNSSGIIDLPFPASKDQYQKQADFIFYATRHWLPLVNGYSSHTPAYYDWLTPAVASHPLPPAGYLRALNVDHVVVHWGKFIPQDRARIRQAVRKNPRDFKEAWSQGAITAYRVISKEIPVQEGQILLLPQDAKLSSSRRKHRLSRLRDGALSRRWGTGASQKKGDWLKIELSQPLDLKGVVLELGAWNSDYPRGIRVDVLVGGQWKSVYAEQSSAPKETDFISLVQNPGNPSIRYQWRSEKVSALKLILTEDTAAHHWSVAEMKLLI